MDRLRLKGMVFAALFAAFTSVIAPVKIPLGFTPVPITLQTLAVLMSGAMLGPVYGALSMIIYLLMGAIGLPVFAGGGCCAEALFGYTGGYLLSYPVAAFVIGKMLEKKKLSKFLKFGSFIAIMALVVVTAVDLIFRIGIIEPWDSNSKSYVPLVSLISEQQRLIFIGICVCILFLFALILFYGKKLKSLDIVLAMFTGTLVIYIMGAIQGQFVTKLPWSAIFVGWVLPFILGDTIKLLLAAWIAKSVDIGKYMK